MAKEVQLKELVSYLDGYLDPMKISDVSVNGLQVPGASLVRKVAVATDVSLDVFKETVRLGCNFLFVHHGLFWNFNREGSISELLKEKLKILFDHDISLYASHLPLDMHPEVGNNKVLFDLFGLIHMEPMGFSHGQPIGFMGVLPHPKDFPSFVELVEDKIKDKVRFFHFSDKPVKQVAIISGGGQSGLYETSAGFDTFVTGEMNHYMYHVAKENKINVILAGHYRTETFGPKAVGELLANRYGLPWEFLEFPTGL